MRTRAAAAILAVTAVAAAGCAAGTGTAAAADGPPTGRITVLAAASLTDAFTTLGADFEDTHPGSTVRFSFGSSSALATQITQGAPADVFASASAANMDTVVGGGWAASATPFVANRMQIAVPPDNPAGITGLSDLARPDVTVALCQVEAPCGTVAAQVLRNAGLSVTPVTQEADVKATLAKVMLGEVDAAVVYVTDVLAAGDRVRGIEIPDGVNASTTYPVAALTGSPNPPLARAFVDYLLSAEGLRVLHRAGFAAP